MNPGNKYKNLEDQALHIFSELGVLCNELKKIDETNFSGICTRAMLVYAFILLGEVLRYMHDANCNLEELEIVASKIVKIQKKNMRLDGNSFRDHSAHPGKISSRKRQGTILYEDENGMIRETYFRHFGVYVVKGGNEEFYDEQSYYVHVERPIPEGDFALCSGELDILLKSELIPLVRVCISEMKKNFNIANL